MSDRRKILAYDGPAVAGRTPLAVAGRIPGPIAASDLTPNERTCLAVVRSLGPEALERLLLCGRFQWVDDILKGRNPA